MNDPILDRHLANCKELLQCWQRFHRYLQESMSGKDFDDHAEAAFLKLKSQIAILHDSLMESIEAGNRETAAMAQSVITVIENCILLRQVKRMNTPELKRMEIEWHESYLLINETIGALEDKVERLAHISKVQYYANLAAGKSLKFIGHTIGDRRFHYAVAAIAVIFATIGLPMMGIFSYDFLNEYDVTKDAYVIARSMIRNSVMKKLEFLNWKAYDGLPDHERGRRPMPGGCNKQETGVPREEALAEAFLHKSLTGLETLDVRQKAADAEKHAERYEKSNDDIYILFLYFKTNFEAMDLLDEILEWKRKVPQDSPHFAHEDSFVYGRYNNVAFGIQSPYIAKEVLTDIADSLMGVKKK